LLNCEPSEYLAVSTFCSGQATLSRSASSTPALVQIWSLDTSNSSDLSVSTEEGSDGRIKLVMGLCIEVGEAWELQWCPKGGEERLSKAMVTDDRSSAKLGILAGAFSDGSVSLFVVPDPAGVRAEKQVSNDEELFGGIVLGPARALGADVVLRQSRPVPS
jgi:transcription factor C subunit 6